MKKGGTALDAALTVALHSAECAARDLASAYEMSDQITAMVLHPLVEPARHMHYVLERLVQLRLDAHVTA